MIYQHWPPSFRARFGGHWPESYLCLDTETCGFVRDKDLVVEVGHVLVRDGAVVDRGGFLVNWTGAGVAPDWLAQRLAAASAGMAAQGHTCHTTPARLAREGRPPAEVFGFYGKLIRQLRGGGVLLAMHCGYRFDEGMLAHSFRRAGVDDAFRFDDDGLFDTEAIEKANQGLLVHERYSKLVPRPDDSLRSYFTRVGYARMPAVKSNLSDHCRLRYDFARHGLTADNMHAAETDAFAVHLLMEAWRPLAVAAAAAPPPPPPPPSPLPPSVPPAPPGPPGAPGPARYRGQRNR